MARLRGFVRIEGQLRWRATVCPGLSAWCVHAAQTGLFNQRLSSRSCPKSTNFIESTRCNGV